MSYRSGNKGGSSKLMMIIGVVVVAYFAMKFLNGFNTNNQSPNPLDEISNNRNTPLDDIISNDRGTNTNSNQDEIIRQQQEKIRQLEEQARQREQGNSRPSPYQDNRSTTSQNSDYIDSNSDNPSLDDLFEDYDRKNGNLSPPTSNRNNNVPTESLGAWNFSYGNISGTIELFTKGQQIYTRVKSGVGYDDFEMERRGDRFYVLNSPTGEYYVYKQNGDFDAYDQNGFQTTCTRTR